MLGLKHYLCLNTDIDTTQVIVICDSTQNRIKFFFIYYIFYKLFQIITPMINMAEGKIKLNVNGHTEPTFMDILTANKIDIDFEIKYM